MFTYFPPYTFGISHKLQFSHQGICMYVVYTGNRTETENTFFPTIFLRTVVHQEKKGLTGGALDGIWRPTPSYAVNTSNGGNLRNDIRMVEHLGSIVVLFATWMTSAPCSEAWPATTIHWLFYIFLFSSFPFSILIWISFVSSCLFLWVICCLLGFGFCRDSCRIWYTEYVSWYIRTLISPFYYCLRYTFCFSGCVYFLLFLFCFSSWGNLPVQSYWSLSCDHGLHRSDELILNVRRTTTSVMRDQKEGRWVPGNPGRGKGRHNLIPLLLPVTTVCPEGREGNYRTRYRTRRTCVAHPGDFFFCDA